MCVVSYYLLFRYSFPSHRHSSPFLVRGDSVKTFLFQNVNIIEIDKDQITNENDNSNLAENEIQFTDEVSAKDALDETIDEEALKVEPFVEETSNDDAVEKESLTGETLDNEKLEASSEELEPPKSAGSLTLRQIMREEEFEEISRRTRSAQLKTDETGSETGEDFLNDVESSQASEDETIINNYENNNDSAYETNEINSQNGSSRLQSAETINGDDDVDTETGENFKANGNEAGEVETFETSDEGNVNQIDDDNEVVVNAVKSKETGSSEIESTGNEVIGDKEVQCSFPLDCIVYKALACIII